MYAEALNRKRIRIPEIPVVKLMVPIAAAVIFSGQNMTMNAYETGEILKGYIQENNVKKEQSTDALFLLKEKWNNELNRKYGATAVKYIDDGVVYVSMIKTVNSRRVKINIAEINRNINSEIEIIPQLASNKMHSKSKVNNIAINSKALVAINGTYFKQDTGTPLGTLVINGEIISGPVYDRAAFIISSDGFSTGRVAFTGEVKGNNTQVKLDNINQPRMMSSNVLLYTSDWGLRSPAVKAQVRNIAVKNEKIVEISQLPVMIPQDGYVISGPVEKLKDFHSGEKVEIKYSLNTDGVDVQHIISGGPYLMKNGSVYTDTVLEKLSAIDGRNPRTAVGYTKDNVMILVTADGRKEGSSGLTISESANLMKSLGCYEAINLDGGSSTVMYADGNIYSGTNIKNAVSVSNALVVRKKA